MQSDHFGYNLKGGIVTFAAEAELLPNEFDSDLTTEIRDNTKYYYYVLKFFGGFGKLRDINNGIGKKILFRHALFT